QVEDESDSENTDEESDDNLSESDIEEADDAVSQLLATFSTKTRKAVDSDEEESEEESDEDENDDVEDEEGEIEEADIDEGKKAEEIEDGIENDSAEDSDENSDVEDCEQQSDDDDDDYDNIENDDECVDVEEGTENEASDLEDKDDEAQTCSSNVEDVFSQHYERNLNDTNAEQVKDLKNWSPTFQTWPILGRLKMETPKVLDEGKKLLLLEEDEVSKPNIGILPIAPDKTDYTIDKYNIKKVIRDNLSFSNEGSSSLCLSSLSDLQKEVLAILTNYSDLYYPEATHNRWDELRMVYCLHAINHILKTRSKILLHNGKINKARKEKSLEDLDSYRDQGYARPKVVILVPFRHSAFKVIETIIKLIFREDNKGEVQNHKRFIEDFGPDQNQSKPHRLERPEDFEEIFKGKTDEDFKIGLTLTKKSLKLYTDFYMSDIIVASPLGLRQTVGVPGEKDADTDFLTSIEMLILDQADIFVMQNWEHLLILMSAMNLPPRDLHALKIDLTRVRLWSIDGHSPLYRQTLLFSATPIDHNRALLTKCNNITGRVQVLNIPDRGTVQEVAVRSELVLTRVPGLRDPDARFTYFTKELLPQFRSGLRNHTLIYIPDYCDYVRLVRFFKEDRGSSIATINEYMVGQNQKVAKARSLFFEGRRQFLLYTERFHFYRRYRMKGVRHIIFYDLPTYTHYFSEICNLMLEGLQNPQEEHLGSSTVTVLYQKSDQTKMIGVLGASRTKEVIKSEQPIHLCVIGS
ncbi:unnamed protein product, partial [Meganyctiphanes norvegica]